MAINLKLQFEKNLLAIISLAVAIVALSYNSWRNELSEDNRNIREAGFEVMREAAKLQAYIDTKTYTDKDNSDEAIAGWVSINLIVSLSELISVDIQSEAINLKTVWTENWSGLNEDKAANQKITQANNQLVSAVRTHLARLK
ncbi:hypothetical protein FLL45_09620 [Aliikangiella marina]|uniref:DUF2489 domain-containing protein n=1 Tax=Aliikangiella marina TaxID=1712262 RepID=A0A545TD90_9GAMM|nr:hypothetical protein [Aliikangiella marina]TQV75187.1 hypothetical protein FLL45_09620 [Aliikangiella marina]